MRWQDIVIAVVQVAFVFSMLPSILSKSKPALITSTSNVVLVLIITFCLLTLKLWFSAASALAIAITWGVLAVQKLGSSKSGSKLKP